MRCAAWDPTCAEPNHVQCISLNSCGLKLCIMCSFHLPLCDNVCQPSLIFSLVACGASAILPMLPSLVATIALWQRGLVCLMQLEERIQALGGMIRAAAPGEELLPLAERCDLLLR